MSRRNGNCVANPLSHCPEPGEGMTGRNVLGLTHAAARHDGSHAKRDIASNSEFCGTASKVFLLARQHLAAAAAAGVRADRAHLFQLLYQSGRAGMADAQLALEHRDGDLALGLN